MPAAAREALKGLLAEGIEADEVLMRLQDAGYKVAPPEGDESYAGPDAMDRETLPEEPEVTEDEDKPPLMAEGGPQDPMSKYAKAAKSAMKKHGMKGDDEDEEPLPDGP